MKLTKLLTGAAVAALLTGAANAQVTSAIYQGDTSAPNLSGTPFAGDNVFVSEAGSIAGLSVPLEFHIEPGGTATAFTSSPNVEVLLTVSVTNAVLDRSLSDTDIVGGPLNCVDSELTVDANGAAGQNTVTFRIADIGDCDANTNALAGAGDENIQFSFPLLLSGGDVNLTYEMRRAADNTLITSGTWAANEANATFAAGAVQGPLITQASAFRVTSGTVDTATADQAAGGGAYTDLALDDTFTNAVTLAMSGALMPLAGVSPFAPAAAGDLDDVITVCTFANGTGLDESAHTLGGVAASANTTTTSTFDLVGRIGAGANDLVLNETAPVAAIRSQNVTCAGTFDWDQAGNPALANYTNVDFSVVAGYIRRNGIESGTFEWVGDANQSTRNVFRITGLGATAPNATVIVSNSNAGMDGEYDITLPTPVNGEIIVSDGLLTQAIGNFGRADIQFSLKQAATANSVAIRRFLVGNNGTLTDFGNENDDTTNGLIPTITPAGNAGGGSN